MNVDVTIEAELLLAFWANNRKSRLVSCVTSQWREVRKIEQQYILYAILFWKKREMPRNFTALTVQLKIFSSGLVNQSISHSINTHNQKKSTVSVIFKKYVTTTT